MNTRTWLPRPVRILDVHRQNATDVTLFFENTSDPPQPGQFFEVSLPRIGEAPISVSDFATGHIEMTVRSVGPLTAALCAKLPGDVIHVRGPYGHGFPLDTLRSGPLVIAAGGTGTAPVKSLIRLMSADAATASRLHVLLGFRSPADLLFREELTSWASLTNLQVTVDRGDAGWTGHLGVITSLIPSLPLAEPEATRVVVVGPPLMMKFTLLAMLERGIREENLWVSYERRMSCGLGKCGRCKIHDRYVCLDGPVFPFSEARWLAD